MVLNKNEIEVERLMREGQAAVKRGDKAMSRTLLTQLLELEPHNEQAWMWLSGAVTDRTEQQTCLENVLILNPNNEQARKGLEYIRAKTGKPTSDAFDGLTGPLPIPTNSAPAQSSNVPNSTAALMQSDTGATFTDLSQTAPMMTQAEGVSLTAENEHSNHTDFAPAAPSQADATNFMEASSIEEMPTFGEAFDPIDIDGVMPFQVPDDARPTVYAGHPPAEEMLPDTGMVIPGQDIDLDSWLDDLAAGVSPDMAEQPQSEVASAHLPTPDTEQFAPQGPFPMDPFSSPGPMDFPPVGPYTGAQLPSPEDLPGSHGDSELAQPWYLQPSNDPAVATPNEAASVGYPVDGDQAENSNSAVPVATLECPNCHQDVPETSLACPVCQYSFFVHCPHCHELVDTSAAKPDVIEPCPYCSADINKMELGLINSPTQPRLRESAPKESEKSWVGEGLVRPEQRRGFLLTFSWVIDLAWLMLIVLMVWALTQLPSWWHLTNLYN